MSAHLPNLARHAKSILLVEDEPPLRCVVKRILERSGYKVLEAESGPEALAVWRQHIEEIGLLFTDMIMPDGISGRELAERLQSEKRSLRVIYTTGYSPEMVAPDFLLREGIDFLLKPYRPFELIRAIQASLGVGEAEEAPERLTARLSY
jgi:two-component system cell cycle sensor histidine kinase/response regulator CckA